MAAAVLYSAVAVLFAPYTTGQRIATGLPCVAAVVVAVRRGWHRPSWRQPDEGEGDHHAAIAVWLVLIGVAVAVQLLNYFDGPRDVYPTLSSLASKVFWIYPVRAAAFAAWLWLGWYVLDR